MNKTLIFIFGTRPEAIKMAPLVNRFKRSNSGFDVKVCITAQHREMLDQVLDFFELKPDYDLNLMKPNQNLYNLTADIVSNIKEVFEDCKPEFAFVHGDTTTTMAASLASFYFGTKVCHIEAGLRTNNIKSPFPEEMNRMVTSVLTDIHFAPTIKSKANLLAENINEDKIIITGNTVIDALLNSVDRVTNENFVHPEVEYLKTIIDPSKKLVLVTGHRRENHGEGFISICNGLNRLGNEDNIQIIYPVHLNPNVQQPVYEILGDNENIKLINPLSYPAFVWLMDKSSLIITDSGGIQEEAPSLGKPVLVMRDTTERPEAVEAETVILVGTDEEKIYSKTLDLLNNEYKYRSMSRKHNPYGDGVACDIIYDYIKAQYQ
jgi:UDP-N-acetylglucosamine 2-epimerase (non-hydrolysing)